MYGRTYFCHALEETAEYVIRSRGREDEGRRLHRLFDLAWEYTLHEFPGAVAHGATLKRR